MDFLFSTSENGDLLSNDVENSNQQLESTSFFSNDIISYHNINSNNTTINLCNSNLSLPINTNTNNMILNDNVPLYIEQQHQQQQIQQDYNQVQQQIQNQLFQYNQQLLQQQSPSNNWNSNTHHQQLFSSDYSSSSPETNQSFSPINELPQSPYLHSVPTNETSPSSSLINHQQQYHHTNIQQQFTNENVPNTMPNSSPETIVPMQHQTTPSSPSSSSSSSDEKIDKPKKIKKRKLFDPSVFRGADLSDVLLEISSEDFKEYKKNFFTGNKVSKSDQNLINAQYRKIKNRESAQRSREKKSKHTEEVEDELEKVRSELDEIKQENKKLKIENESLRKQYESSFASNFNSSSSNLSIPSSSQYQQFSNIFNSILSPIGNSSSSIVNSKKVFCIFIFAIALCFYMAATPNFQNQYQNGGISSSSPSSAITSFTGGNPSIRPYTDQISNSHANNLQYGNGIGGRSPLANLENDRHSSNVQTASYSFDSLSNSPHPHPQPQPQSKSTKQQQQEKESTPTILQLDQQKQQQLLNREYVKPFSTESQNVKATFSFNPNNGLKLYKSLPRSIRDRISNRKEKDQEMYDIGEEFSDSDDNNFEVDSNNNIVFRAPPLHANNIQLLDDDDDPTNNIIKPSKSTTTTTTTTTTGTPRVNNSTMELTVQNNLQIIDGLFESQDSNSTRLPASSYNFKFLIDGNTFLGSNEVAKALAESHNQHLEFISILVQINKNPPM